MIGPVSTLTVIEPEISCLKYLLSFFVLVSLTVLGGILIEVLDALLSTVTCSINRSLAPSVSLVFDFRGG